MITPKAKIPITQQCQVLDISRSTAYYRPKPVPEKDLILMKRLDELHMAYPFAGTRMLRDLLRQEDKHVNRKRVQRLMRLMGISALYPKRNTTIPFKGHKIYPYLLRDLKIDRPNQVWCADITYIPLSKGFGYLVAIMDWYSRKVLSWRFSNTMDHTFCVDVLNEALSKFGKPEIFNTDQGSQFTSEAFTTVLKQNDIRISMDGKGRWMDNRFIERLWRSLKYEDIYLNCYGKMREAEHGIGKYLTFYNQVRPHQTLNGQTPDQVYNRKQKEKAA
jgi:putative transposase